MLKRISFILKYWFYWIVIFQAGRIIFFLINFRDAKSAGFASCANSALHGLRMDASMAAYITVPVILLVIAHLFITKLNVFKLVKFYSLAILFLSLLLNMIDGNAYKSWGFRLDASVMKYLNNPKEAWASVSNLPILWLFLALLLIVFLFYKALAKFVLPIENFTHSYRWQNLLLLILLLGAGIIPIRGGLQLAPLNQSTVYFSDNDFLNKAAINAQWNFIFSLLKKTEVTNNPFKLLSDTEADKIVSGLYSENKNNFFIYDTLKTSRPNVILIVWESFTSKVLGMQVEGKPVVPGFEGLAKEGILFDSIYATGDRTDKGIVGILSGYPAQPTASIIKDPQKASQLPILSKILAGEGYQTSFYYGGELEFANMKAYLLDGKFHRYISIYDFDKKDQNSKWGAHDGVVADKLSGGLSGSSEPFFATWLTLSSHEPFETPVAKVFSGNDDASLFLNSLKYTDSIIAAFINHCKSLPWWKNTLVIITGDHGHRLPSTGKRVDDFKIPLLITGGALTVKDTIVHNIVSQIDIPRTLLAQLRNKRNTEFVWGKNLFNSQNQWAYSAYNNGFAYYSPLGYCFFDNTGKNVFERKGNIDSAHIKKGIAFQQKSFGDYLTK